MTLFHIKDKVLGNGAIWNVALRTESILKVLPWFKIRITSCETWKCSRTLFQRPPHPPEYSLLLQAQIIKSTWKIIDGEFLTVTIQIIPICGWSNERVLRVTVLEICPTDKFYFPWCKRCRRSHPCKNVKFALFISTFEEEKYAAMSNLYWLVPLFHGGCGSYLYNHGCPYMGTSG